MRVIPECAGRMIGRNLILVFETSPGGTNLNEHVIAVSFRRYVQAVRMEVGGVDSHRGVVHALVVHIGASRAVRRQLIGDPDGELVPGLTDSAGPTAAPL